jgi:hypothetical protein
LRQIDPDLGNLKDMTTKLADETGFDILIHCQDFFVFAVSAKRKKG